MAAVEDAVQMLDAEVTGDQIREDPAKGCMLMPCRPTRRHVNHWTKTRMFSSFALQFRPVQNIYTMIRLRKERSIAPDAQMAGSLARFPGKAAGKAGPALEPQGTSHHKPRLLSLQLSATVPPRAPAFSGLVVLVRGTGRAKGLPPGPELIRPPQPNVANNRRRSGWECRSMGLHRSRRMRPSHSGPVVKLPQPRGVGVRLIAGELEPDGQANQIPDPFGQAAVSPSSFCLSSSQQTGQTRQK